MAALAIGDTVRIIEKGKPEVSGVVKSWHGQIGNQTVNVELPDGSVRENIPHKDASKTLYWLQPDE